MPSFNGPAVDAVLSAASALLGMELVYIGTLDSETFTFARVKGEWEGFDEGAQSAAQDSLCSRMLTSGEWSTPDAPTSRTYGDAPAVARYGIRSYVGVPVRVPGGRTVATLCGVDHRPGHDKGASGVQEATRAVLGQLAIALAALIDDEHAATDDVVIRRGERGWTVSGDGQIGDPADELTTAMVLADLLSDDRATPPRPVRETDPPVDEVDRLRRSVKQLEHALAARVVVEQAIGVLTERTGTAPKDNFDQLRRVARSRGRKVVDLARLVVSSAQGDEPDLPPELSGR